MARVVDDRTSRVDHFLDYSLREWGAAPSYIEEFSTWDDLGQLTFIHEWSIRESALSMLADYARQDLLTSRQTERYHRLLALVACHRSSIEKLVQD